MPVRRQVPHRSLAAPRPAPALADARASSLLLATTPLWLARVGLYQYLALEVMIWMLFALGYNLMLGTTGLPSFGHGAFFGVGAYAFGLLQQRVLRQPLVRPRSARCSSPRRSRRGGGGLHRPQARHLLRAADDRLRPGVLVRRRQVAQRHRRRGRPAQHRAGRCADFGFGERRPAQQPGALLLLLRRLRARRRSPSGGWCIRRSGACCARSGRTRCAPPSSATTCGSTSGWRSRSRRRSPGWPARCSRWRSSRRTRT